MCIHGGSHLGVVDRSGSSKWYIWFLRWCWLQFHSDIVGGWQGICCTFISGKWVYWGLFVIINFLQCGRQRWRMLSCWYWQWDWCKWSWCWSGCRSCSWCQSVCGWVGARVRTPSAISWARKVNSSFSRDRICSSKES